jgi:hypothetical protein
MPLRDGSADVVVSGLVLNFFTISRRTCRNGNGLLPAASVGAPRLELLAAAWML